jgi:AcrR family transcriptional regulator
MAAKSLAPRQARSRESERKLLHAAAKVLSAHGLDGTTIPRIAEAAGLTPGAVYRRFPDKNALLETVLLRLIEDSHEHARRVLTPAEVRAHTLPELLELVIASMIRSSRAHAGLLRSLRQFLETSDHKAFKDRVFEKEKDSIENLVEVLMAHRARITHPSPRIALGFAITVVVSTLFGLFALDAPLGVWPLRSRGRLVTAAGAQEDVSVLPGLPRLRGAGGIPAIPVAGG